MDIEFHYYVTYILAKEAGFDEDEAATIAYSSQYVDDNSCIFRINKGAANEYENYISQTMNIAKPKRELMRIYPLFHFIPGDPLSRTAKRRDGQMHMLNTTPDSRRANRLIDEALSLTPMNPYRIGIATHSYMDTWSHQNFLGDFAGFNSMEGIKEKLAPNIGHADAGHGPDIPGLIWKDRRLVRAARVVSNKSRFLDAARRVFQKYVKAVQPRESKQETSRRWRKLRGVLSAAVGNESTEDSHERRQARIEKYETMANGIPEYNKDKWFRESVETNVRGLPDIWDVVTLLPDRHKWRRGYRDKDWHKFQEAVKTHQHAAELLCEDIFEQVEVEHY